MSADINAPTYYEKGVDYLMLAERFRTHSFDERENSGKRENARRDALVSAQLGIGYLLAAQIGTNKGRMI